MSEATQPEPLPKKKARGCLTNIALAILALVIFYLVLILIVSRLPPELIAALDAANTQPAKVAVSNPPPAPPRVESVAAPARNSDSRSDHLKDFMQAYYQDDVRLPAPVWQDCDKAGAKDECISALKNMIVEAWPGAWLGDIGSQREVAECLESGCFAAVQISQLDACAWRLVIAASMNAELRESDASELQNTCSQLSDSEKLVAKSKAGGMIDKIPTRAATVPKSLRDMAATF